MADQLRQAAQTLVQAIDNDEEGRDLGGYDHLADELAALRAALAIRPEPLWRGQAKELDHATELWRNPYQWVVVYPAAAGSASPELMIDAGHLRRIDELLTPDEREKLQTDLRELARLRRRAEAESCNIVLGSTAADSASPEGVKFRDDPPRPPRR